MPIFISFFFLKINKKYYFFNIYVNFFISNTPCKVKQRPHKFFRVASPLTNQGRRRYIEKSSLALSSYCFGKHGLSCSGGPVQ